MFRNNNLTQIDSNEEEKKKLDIGPPFDFQHIHHVVVTSLLQLEVKKFIF